MIIGYLPYTMNSSEVIYFCICDKCGKRYDTESYDDDDIVDTNLCSDCDGHIDIELDDDMPF